ncbi:F0F1 ATP synthase subunit delta [Lactococcus garvieae]|jgi:F-type H+-transporting ATPase subunit delta|uniref:ATP synthase subunit delta n=1 Tax=Lactococcus garvieae DCC43 TaxID=1231377 RepID=K2PKG2_9LACT|nr:F0F1 ATP synthase subunit delta [Lactococcus garvieae]EKF51870.1 ATP synthase delta chain [Lactococcus garvieae DCC43]QPS71211.1 F0F1 ATP synthase subunit delta [Lactococcus garvieae]
MTTVSSQKYSKALLEVAEEQSQLEVILAEVNELTQLFKEDDLASFFGTEVYSASAKSKVIDSIKETSSDLMKNFLDTVRSNGRLANLAEILAEIKNTADDMFKIADVEVITSVKLTETQIEKFVALAKSKFDLNEVTIVNTVDEKIVGGFIVNSRGKIIDASVKSQLAKIAKEIL